MYKMGAPSVKLTFDLLAFHHNLLLVNFGYVMYSNVCINNSSDNLTKSFIIHERYGC